MEEARDAKSKELEEVKKQYQLRLIEEENESKMRRKAASENAQLKYTKPLGRSLWFSFGYILNWLKCGLLFYPRP